MPWVGDGAMKVRLGEFHAQCPYCEHTDFQASDEESLELVCEHCGGYASRAVVLERVADKAGELGRLTLARLKLERSRRKRPDRT
jgi:PHP family Zn ribbon phosphoesterase